MKTTRTILGRAQRGLAGGWAGMVLVLFGIAVGVAKGQSPTLDPGFRPVISRAGGLVSALAVQPDGQVIIAGAFHAIDGVVRVGLARLRSDGTVDPGFDPGVGGCCGRAQTFGNEWTAPITAVAVQADGKVLVGGSFSSFGGQARAGLARLLPNGTLDPSFNPGSGLGLAVATDVPTVSGFAPQADGKIVVTGYFTRVNGVARNGIVRLQGDGSIDASFDPGSAVPPDDGIGGAGRILGVVRLADGRYLVGGNIAFFDGVVRNGMARLENQGRLDASFDPVVYKINLQDGPPTLDGFAVAPDGKILISGAFDAVDNEHRRGLARLLPNGSLDESFLPVIDREAGEAYTVLGVQPDGKVLAYRQAPDPGGNSRRVITRLNLDGSLDASFELDLGTGAGSRFRVAGAVRQGDGRWVVAGQFETAAGTVQRGVVRMGLAGGLDATYTPELELAEGTGAGVESVVVQKDGQVVVGGGFDRINGLVRASLARLRRDGSLDASFAPMFQTEANRGVIATLLLQPDGKLLVGGAFHGVNGVERSGLVRLNPDGTVDPTFAPGAGAREKDNFGSDRVGEVRSLALQADGRILLGGNFSHYNGIASPWIARVMADGSFDATFEPGLSVCAECVSPEIRGIVPRSDGSVIIRGLLDRFGGLVYHGLAKLLPEGTMDFPFNGVTLPDDEVTAMVAGKLDDVLLAVTSTDAASGARRTRLGRLGLTGALDATFQAEPVWGDVSSTAPISAMALDREGRWLIAGGFVRIGEVPRQGFARLSAAGALEPGFALGSGFGPGLLPAGDLARDRVTGLVEDVGGDWVVGGRFVVVEGQVRLGLARFQVGGTGPGGGGDRPRLMGLTRSSVGVVSLGVAGVAGRTYWVEASSDLKTWTRLGSVVGAAGSVPFTDAGAAGVSARYYRASE